MTALLTCVALSVNCSYAVAALSAAARNGIYVRLGRGIGLGIILTGTAIECAILFNAHDVVTQIAILVAFGAVIVSAACDASCGYVFDAITAPCLAVMFVVSIVFHTFVDVSWGAAAAGGSLYLLHAVTKGRGLGLGDAKLACCIGACAGVLGGLEALGVAFVLGGVIAGFLLLSKRARRGTELRFAPYLATGLAIVMLHGSAL